MRALDSKLRRDLWRLKWQLAAIALLIGSGVSVAVMTASAQEAIATSQRRYYLQTRFADVFASATRAPIAIADHLARLDGVTAVDPRAVGVGFMRVPGLVRPATARLISLPPHGRQPLNQLVLTAGRFPRPGNLDEAVALKTFLDAAHVALGDRLTVTIVGHQLTFTIVGAALSPEYAYVPGASPLPDDAHQAVLWANAEAVEGATGLHRAFSTIALALAPGTSDAVVRASVDRALAPYGGAPAIARADQVSHKFQADHIAQLGAMSKVLPPVFFVVGAALVQLVLARLVDAEREQIGLLKAFGYRNGEAAANYLAMALIIAVVGAVAGGAFGGWIGRALTRMFEKTLRSPYLEPQFSWRAFAVSSILSLILAALASLRAVMTVVRLSPAVAMQPPVPSVFRTIALERLRLWRRVDQPSRMIVRGLARRPVRALLTVGGLSLSVAVLVASQFLFGSIDTMIEHGYYRIRHWTEEVSFAQPRAIYAATELARLPGVLRAEPVRSAGGRLQAGGREMRIAILGWDDAAALTSLLDVGDRPIALRPGSLVVSQALATRLSLTPGQMVDVEITSGIRPHWSQPIAGIANDFAGYVAYMSRSTLNARLLEGDVATGADLLVADDARASFYRALATRTQIVSTHSRSDTVSAFRSTFAAIMTTEMAFFLGFAALIAFAIAFNIARVGYSDRARDLATLRVLGFSSIDCAYVLCGELLLQAAVAIPTGVLLGAGLGKLLIHMLAEQGFQPPFVLAPSALAESLAIYGAAIVTAALLVGQRIWKLDLVAVLKTRD